MKKRRSSWILLLLLLCSACSTTPPAPKVVTKTKVVVPQPPQALLKACQPATPAPVTNVGSIVSNLEAWETAYALCAQRHACLSVWVYKAGKGKAPNGCGRQ